MDEDNLYDITIVHNTPVPKPVVNNRYDVTISDCHSHERIKLLVSPHGVVDAVTRYA